MQQHTGINVNVPNIWKLWVANYPLHHNVQKNARDQNGK